MANARKGGAKYDYLLKLLLIGDSGEFVEWAKWACITYDWPTVSPRLAYRVTYDWSTVLPCDRFPVKAQLTSLPSLDILFRCGQVVPAFAIHR